MTSGSTTPIALSPLRGVSVGGHKVIGAKHARDGRPCQDDVAVVQHGSVAVLVVADGHGSSIHAELGARFAVEVASEQLMSFAAGLEKEHQADPRAVHGLAEDPLRRLLVREWARRVRDHAGPEGRDLKDYGSTLIFVLATPDFILLGQLGDGDLIMVDADGSVSRPLPSDPRCFGEETPSLCSPDALASLRVLAMPVPEGETLILISTDGYGKSYATDAEFERVGPDYLELVREIGIAGVSENLEEFLTAVTTGGSGDDIALGLLYLPQGLPVGQFTKTSVVSDEALSSETPGASVSTVEGVKSVPEERRAPDADTSASGTNTGSPRANRDPRPQT